MSEVPEQISEEEFRKHDVPAPEAHLVGVMVEVSWFRFKHLLGTVVQFRDKEYGWVTLAHDETGHFRGIDIGGFGALSREGAVEALMKSMGHHKDIVQVNDELDILRSDGSITTIDSLREQLEKEGWEPEEVEEEEEDGESRVLN